MRTKRLTVDARTLEILKHQITWAGDGLSAVIAPLDRKDYQRVAKVFSKLGGKWNRKAQATLFEADPRPQIEGLIDTGKIDLAQYDFFVTPTDVVRQMLRHAEEQIGDLVGREILEPQAGTGAIATPLRERGNSVVCIELHEDRAAELAALGFKVTQGDFLEVEPTDRFDLVVMNPPFSGGAGPAHVRHAARFLKPEGSLVAILDEGAFTRSYKADVAFQQWVEARGGESHKLPAGAFSTSGTGVNTRILVLPPAA